MTKLEKSLLAGAALLVAVAARRARRRDPRELFANRAAVVTGGACGIGRALVMRLRELGARVLAVDIDAEQLATLASVAPGVATLELDLAERSAPERLLAAAVERLGGLDVLFSNAGLIWAAPFLSMRDDDIDKLVDVNLAMQVRLTRHVLAFMAERGGTIAYTGSLSSYVHSPLHSVYTGTKGGLNSFVRALRREIRRDLPHVRLAIVQPNVTRTGLAASDLFDEIAKRYTLQTPEQVAGAFLDGLASGRDEIFVEVADHLWKWAERVASPAVSLAFRAGTSDELIAMAEAAVDDSKLRRQLARGDGDDSRSGTR